MNKSIKAAQGGFTLIELIVVIVILGILAATALPKFASLSGEARLASLNAAKGSLSATSAMTHGKWLVAPDMAGKKVTVEGTAVTMNTTSGYPATLNQTQADALATAAGLAATDYKVYVKGSGTTRPTVGAGQFAVVPYSIVNTATAVNCHVLYEGSTAANTPPTITVGSPTTPADVKACE
jgi:MSHA pilin protein MshA